MNFKEYVFCEAVGPKKGDTIWTADIWSDGEEGGSAAQPEKKFVNPRIYVWKLIVQSWGKKQATFIDPATNQFVKCRGFTDEFPYAFEREGLAEHIEVLKQRIRRSQQSRINNQKYWLENYKFKALPKYVRHAEEEIKTLEKWINFPIEIKDHSEVSNRSEMYSMPRKRNSLDEL